MKHLFCLFFMWASTAVSLSCEDMENIERRFYLSFLVPKLVLSYHFSPSSQTPRQYTFNADEPYVIGENVYDNSLLDYIDGGDRALAPGLQTEYDGEKNALFLNFVWQFDEMLAFRDERRREDEEDGRERRKRAAAYVDLPKELEAYFNEHLAASRQAIRMQLDPACFRAYELASLQSE